jgi:hypothetical protein
MVLEVLQKEQYLHIYLCIGSRSGLRTKKKSEKNENKKVKVPGFNKMICLYNFMWLFYLCSNNNRLR